MASDGSRENEKIVRDFFGALVAGDVDKMMEMATDDLSWTLMGSTPASGTFRGRDAVLRDSFGPIGEVIDFEAGVDLEIVDLIAAGDRVVVRAEGKMQGKHGPYNNQYCHVMTVRDGKVAATIEYCDTALVETQLFGKTL